MHPTVKGAFCGITTYQISRTQMGNSKPTKNFRFQKFISFILSEFNGTIIFQICANVREIARKLLLRHGRLELTLVVNTAFYSSISDNFFRRTKVDQNTPSIEHIHSNLSTCVQADKVGRRFILSADKNFCLTQRNVGRRSADIAVSVNMLAKRCNS